QRTAGNAAVNGLLRQYASAGTAQLTPAKSTVTAIQPRMRAIAGPSGAPLDIGQAPLRARVTGGPEGAVIQRKLVFAQDRFNNLTSTTAKADTSTFVRIKDSYAKYVKLEKPLLEVEEMRRMLPLIDSWQKDHGSSTKEKDLIKKQLLKDLKDAINLELPKAITSAHKWHLREEIGLPAAYLDTWQDVDVETLGKASQNLGRGDIPAADQHLTLLRTSIGDVVNLIKSALLSHHIGKVDPELAKALGDPEYKLGMKDKSIKDKAMTRVNDLATERLNTGTDGERRDFGEAYRSMRGTALDKQRDTKSQDAKALVPSEVASILGYTVCRGGGTACRATLL
ncbi:MAG: hypothetical protein ACRD2G_01155, partial [Terriglobia bacterium]